MALEQRSIQGWQWYLAPVAPGPRAVPGSQRTPLLHHSNSLTRLWLPRAATRDWSRSGNEFLRSDRDPPALIGAEEKARTQVLPLQQRSLERN